MMKQLRIFGTCVLFLAISGTSVRAALIADSIAEFSGVQGQGQWFYGFFDKGTPTGPSFSVGAFQEFDVFNDRWESSEDQVGANNTSFLSINALGGHPTGIGPSTQDRIIWAVRRYVSPVDGLIDIAFDLRKVNVVEPRGGGITGRIFVNGIEVFSQFIGNADDIGVQAVLSQNVSVGSTIDFAIDPTGIQPTNGDDGPFSARADGSMFSATISTPKVGAVPEASTFAVWGVLGLTLSSVCWWRRR